jgi:uncharacterized protein (TIGR03437 family)
MKMSHHTTMNSFNDSNTIPLATTSPTYSGSYSIAACGFGFITNPLSTKDSIWGMVSQYGVFIGSTTETKNAFNDLFIGAPVSSVTPQGAYSVAYMNFPNGYFQDAVTAGFQMTPASESANILMYVAGSASPVDVTEPMSFSYGSGAGTLTFPLYGEAIARTKYFYESPDGGFIFGGGQDAFDLLIGVRTQTTPTATNGFPPGFAANGFSGLYYQVGIDDIISAGTVGSLQTYYGALNVTPGAIMNHQRIVAPLGSPYQGPPITPRLAASAPYQPFNYTYLDTYSLGFGSNIGYTDSATGREYVFGTGGAARLGFGVYPKLGISIALKAATAVTPQGSSPYLSPTGVMNAASYAPYTSGIAPGEIITLFGQDLTSGTDPVTVTINGIEAALAATPSATQVSVIVPPGVVPSDNTGGSYAQIQLNIATSAQTTVSSNIVWAFVNQTAIGVWTQSQTGLGDAYAEDSSSNLLTLANPVAPGATLNIPVNGLGSQSAPFGISGIFGSTPPASSSITVTIGGLPAPVTAIAPSPQNGAVSIVSVTVPAAATAGDSIIQIAGVDSTTAQATVQVK